MPQHRSAYKRVRQNAHRRTHNHDKKARVRSMIKNLKAMDDPGEAAAYLNDVKGALDRLTSKNIMHKNKAARYKSRLEKSVNALKRETG